MSGGWKDADGGWSASAEAWIADMGARGDFGRVAVLDAPMLARVSAGGFRRALDVGCGEGRFCRMLRARGIEAVGIDPTDRLLAEARMRDPEGDYRLGRAEALGFPDAAFDLVVSYLTLIDIPDLEAAISEMARVLAPGGALLIGNLNPMITASGDPGWRRRPDGALDCYPVDRYLDARPIASEWRGISVTNHHRPMARYMSALLGVGLTLVHFDEPEPDPSLAEPARVDKYRRAPWFHLMEWRKPEA